MSVEEEIMFVNGMAFLFSVSRHVKFTMVQYLVKMTTGNIYELLNKINDIYNRRRIYLEVGGGNAPVGAPGGVILSQ